MGENTSITWAHHTFNPWWGCSAVSDGCRICYAETLAGQRWPRPLWGVNAERRMFGDAHWKEPFTWNIRAERLGTRYRVFSGSMCDVFELNPVLDDARTRLWNIIRYTRNLNWLLLTKRPEQILHQLPRGWPHEFPHVWLGTSIEDMRVAGRADYLRNLEASVRFLSYEPALGPLDDLDLSRIDWVIYGGESGPGFRAHNPEWARSMRARCQAKGIAFFFKQSAGIRSGMRPTLDGETIQEFPTPRIRKAA